MVPTTEQSAIMRPMPIVSSKQESANYLPTTNALARCGSNSSEAADEASKTCVQRIATPLRIDVSTSPHVAAISTNPRTSTIFNETSTKEVRYIFQFLSIYELRKSVCEEALQRPQVERLNRAIKAMSLITRCRRNGRLAGLTHDWPICVVVDPHGRRAACERCCCQLGYVTLRLG
jgi:hypothetical protein